MAPEWIVIYGFAIDEVPHSQWFALDVDMHAHLDHSAVRPRNLIEAMKIAQDFHAYVYDINTVVIRILNTVTQESIPYTGLIV